MSGEAQATAFIIDIFLADRVSFQRAAGRCARVVPSGLGNPVGKIIGAGTDVGSIEVILLVYLDHAVLLVIVGTGGQEGGRRQTAAQKYAYFAGSWFASGAQECGCIVTTFGRVGICFCCA